MDERQELVTRFRDAGVLDAIRWAYQSASTTALEQHDEDAGHDDTLFGLTRHTLFKDRLNRVFACDRYTVGEGADDHVGQDVVLATLTAADIRSMPAIAPGAVTQSYLNFSPGWRFGDVRFLIASCHPGKAATLKWGRKSPTKQRVASQPAPEPVPTLFDDLGGTTDPGLAAAFASATAPSLDMPTYVVAHSLEPFTAARELILGLPRMNTYSASAWWWFENLWADPPADPSTASRPQPEPLPDDVPDAPVTLRPGAARKAKAGPS